MRVQEGEFKKEGDYRGESTVRSTGWRVQDGSTGWRVHEVEYMVEYRVESTGWRVQGGEYRR